MKKRLIFLFAALCGISAMQAATCYDVFLTGSQTTSAYFAPKSNKMSDADAAKILEFVKSLFPNDNEMESISSDEFVGIHCTQACKQKLKDNYDFDGEGYAVWDLKGRIPGEAEVDPVVKEASFVKKKGKQVVKAVIFFDFYEDPTTRTIYYDCFVKDGVVMINNYEWGK